MEKRLWLEVKRAARRLGEIPQREIFPSCKCVIKVPDSEVKGIFGSFFGKKTRENLEFSKNRRTDNSGGIMRKP